MRGEERENNYSFKCVSLSSLSNTEQEYTKSLNVSVDGGRVCKQHPKIREDFMSRSPH